MNKEEKSTNQSYESDGIMGKENNEKKENDSHESEFFNITPESE